MIYVSLLSLQCCNELDLCPFSMTLESFAKMLVGNGRHNRGPVQSSPVQSSPVQSPGSRFYSNPFFVVTFLLHVQPEIEVIILHDSESTNQTVK